MIDHAVVSLTEPTLKGLVDEAYFARQKGADILEWRADHFEATSADAYVPVLEALREALGEMPLLFTLRSSAQGSLRDIDEEVRLAAIEGVIDAKAADIVDIELSLGEQKVRELVEKAHASNLLALVSDHHFEGTPGHHTMDEILLRGVQTGADIVKLAVMAVSEGDELDLMASVFQAYENNPETLFCGISMGELGTITRIAGESFGSALSFCSAQSTTAPGQVDVTLAKQLMARLHEESH